MVSRFRVRLAERRERRRVAFLNANRPRLLIVQRKPIARIVRPSVLRQLEDRRTFHPQGPRRPAAGFFLPRHRLRIPAPRRSVTVATAPGWGMPTLPTPETFSLPYQIGFQAPRQVAVCVRRKVRREVIHARGIAGSRVRRPRRTEYSGVTC